MKPALTNTAFRLTIALIVALVLFSTVHYESYSGPHGSGTSWGLRVGPSTAIYLVWLALTIFAYDRWRKGQVD
jgi:hypothetical protein